MCVSEVLVTKLFLGKNTLKSPRSFNKDRPSTGPRYMNVRQIGSVCRYVVLKTHCSVCMVTNRVDFELSSHVAKNWQKWELFTVAQC